ncbi:hypothetical protein BJV82DRAFT_590517 [Fennellomyces sp. T-0311]|nr:hypothetical protein BJV82DRAFT_590517 [Fennellomyces sp. T-0311]
MAENYASTPTEYSTLQYRSHDATLPTSSPITQFSSVDLYGDYLPSTYTAGSGIGFRRSMGSLDKISYWLHTCQQRLQEDYLESYSGTSSDVSDATQQRRHLLSYYPTPAQAIPASHVHHDSTPPHQQPLISGQSMIANSNHGASPVGQDPKKVTSTASPVHDCFPFMTCEGPSTFPNGLSSSLPSTQSSEYDYLPSPPSHSSDKHPSHEAFLYNGPYNSNETLSSAAGLTSPTKQFRTATMVRHSSASSTLEFHRESYDYMLPETNSPQWYPDEILNSNDQLFAPLRVIDDKNQLREPPPWQPPRRNRRHVLPAGEGAKRQKSPSDLSQQADDRPHHCNECNRRFNRQQDLKRHTKSVHEKDFVHNCELCHRSFSRHDSLLRHQKKCRNDSSISSGESIASSSRTSQRRSNRVTTGSSFSAASRRRNNSMYYK